MSDQIKSGVGNAIVEVIVGIILSAILGIIPKLPLVPASYVGIFQLFDVLFLVGSILVIHEMESWGIGYLVGWLFAAWIMSIAGLVESWLFTIYAVVGGVTLLVKFLRMVGL